MGRIDKGVNCSVQGCEEKGERSITSSKAQMASDLDLDITNKRAYLCKFHYKEWKKATKGERDNERARWAWSHPHKNLDKRFYSVSMRGKVHILYKGHAKVNLNPQVNNCPTITIFCFLISTMISFVLGKLWEKSIPIYRRTGDCRADRRQMENKGTSL